MRYLIDTNILLFAIKEEDRLSKEVSGLLLDPSNTINISSRSIEEIILLLRIGKIEFSRWKETKDIFSHILTGLGSREWGVGSRKTLKFMFFPLPTPY